MKYSFRILIVLIFFFLGPDCPAVGASALEDTLEHQLVGAWAISTVEMRSDCSGIYNNNEVHAAGVSAKASHLFQPGEMVRISKINLKSSRIDLFLKLAEPILQPHMDGPFELFDQHSCKVQLIIPLSRSMIRAKNLDGIRAEVDRVLHVHSSRQAAADDPLWNHRQRADYPENYDETLYQHAVWKAEQVNMEISDRIARAEQDAVRVLDRVRSNRSYTAGFAAGIQSMRRWDERDCDDLLRVSLTTVCRKPEHSGKEYEEGFKDGEELAFDLLLAEGLAQCFVPPPPRP